MNPNCMQLGVVQGTGKVGLAFKTAPDLQGVQQSGTASGLHAHSLLYSSFGGIKMC